MAFAAEEKLGSTSRTGQPGRPGRAFDDRRQHVRGPGFRAGERPEGCTGVDWVPLVRSCSGRADHRATCPALQRPLTC